MVKEEITEEESSAQSLTSKQNFPAVYFFLSLSWTSHLAPERRAQQWGDGGTEDKEERP